MVVTVNQLMEPLPVSVRTIVASQSCGATAELGAVRPVASA